MTDRPDLSPGLRGPTKKSMEAQEAVVTHLWDFARELGVPISEPGQHVNRQRLDAIGPALERIMAAFGYRVASIQ